MTRSYKALVALSLVGLADCGYASTAKIVDTSIDPTVLELAGAKPGMNINEVENALFRSGYTKSGSRESPSWKGLVALHQAEMDGVYVRPSDVDAAPDTLQFTKGHEYITASFQPRPDGNKLVTISYSALSSYISNDEITTSFSKKFGRATIEVGPTTYWCKLNIETSEVRKFCDKSLPNLAILVPLGDEIRAELSGKSWTSDETNRALDSLTRSKDSPSI